MGGLLKKTAAVLAVAAAALAASAMYTETAASARRAAALEVVTVGCTVRLPSTAGPVLLDDAAHTPIGCTDASLDAAGQVVITYPAMVEVVTGWAQSDECLVDRGSGVMLGPSIGLDKAVITLTQGGTPVRGDSPGLVGPTCNLFFGATFLAEVA